MLKVVCFKWKPTKDMVKKLAPGVGKYTSRHVNRLYKAISKNLTIPHEFICITDEPEGIKCRTIPLWDKCSHLGGCYNRLYVFSEEMKEIIGNRFVCIDLDCVVLGNLDSIFSRQDDFVMMEYYKEGRVSKQKYNGSLFMMTAGSRDQVWSKFRFEKSIQEVTEFNKLKINNRRKKSIQRYRGTDQAWINYILGDKEKVFTRDDGVYQYKRLKNKSKPPKNAKLVFFANGCLDPSILGEKWIKKYWNG